ncbi:response regulator transcription factor [Cysteiniphilum sp. QT6929]|uniref:response regulator transcription factor n=1 Tax=Cysteiniphilum sp. QT6929 TaxID=2975055 RepID=UPI0024B391BB|nr:response regulator transcription factor [Cysteiniphilum sp. QT6929]WHN66384.1 response regulator transcription factor [Cysteiniphilum sp. QT6929]
MDNILIVDDDFKLREYFQMVLTKYGFNVLCAQNTKEAEILISNQKIDLIVLDIMMPDEDGISFCKRIAPTIHIPIIMLTAVDDDLDQIVCLEAGAVDYIIKPFKPRILVSKIKSLLSYAQQTHQENKTIDHSSGNIIIDHWQFAREQQCLINQETHEEQSLTKLEYLMLCLFLENNNKVITREQILNALYEDKYAVSDRTIDINISRLRNKLGNRSAKRIKTIHGRGYIFKSDV